jgi:hypothetical protein
VEAPSAGRTKVRNVDRVSICPHMRVTRTIGVGESIHQYLLRRLQEMEQDQQTGVIVLPQASTTTGATGATASGRTVYSRSAISRKHEVRNIDRVSVSPYVRVTRTIGVSERVDHVNLRRSQGEGAGPATGVITFTASILDSWWCWRYSISRTVHCRSTISRQYKIRMSMV